MFKRCRDAAKALSAAYQITWLMAGLSGLLISMEKRRDKLGGGGFILFPVTANIKLLSPFQAFSPRAFF